jgi:ribonuclease Z
MGRTNPLYLYAPENYDQILYTHLNDFDIHLNYNVNFVPLAGKNPVKILDDKYVTVTSFPLKHRVPSFGFLFREKEADRKIIKECITRYEIPIAKIQGIKKGNDFVTTDGTVIINEDITLPPPKPLSYAYCSDTRYFKRLSSFVKDVTLLYHEATFDKDKNDLADLTGHSTTISAAKVAKESKVRTLIIGHFSARYKDITSLVDEARTIFPATVAAEDGKTYEVGNIKP